MTRKKKINISNSDTTCSVSLNNTEITLIQIDKPRCIAITKTGKQYSFQARKDYATGDKCKIHAINECSICLDTISLQKAITLPKCKHVFHTTCLSGWKEKAKLTCPICRTNIEDKTIIQSSPNNLQMDLQSTNIMDILNYYREMNLNDIIEMRNDE